MSLSVKALRPGEVGDSWPILKPYIEMALEHSLGEMDSDEVLQGGLDGIYLFLTFLRDDEIIGVITVESVEYAKKTIVNVPHVGGKDLDEWCELMVETVIQLGKERGASHAISYGRPGWIKWLKPHGFRQQYTILAVDI